MITLTLSDFLILFLMNLGLAVVVAYAVNYVKRKAELSAEEGSNDKEYLKKRIRDAVSETRTVLAELRVNDFKVPTGNRKLTRMNSLIEVLSLSDPDLGTRVWKLVNAPTMIALAGATYKIVEPQGQVARYESEMKKEYFEDLKWALGRCAELEKKPVVTK